MGTTSTRSALLYLSLGLLLLPVTNQTQPIDTDKAAAYLTRYGYMRNGGNMREAYMTMQMDLGLPITGILDSQTQDVMRKPRCGVTHHGTTTHHRRVKRFNVFGFQWGKRGLTYTIREVGGRYTTQLPNNIVESVVSLAFLAWSQVTPLTFTRLRGSQFVGDIDFSFQRQFHDDSFPFDGRGGTLAHALIPDRFLYHFVRVHFDDDERWTIHSRQVSLYQIAMHEIGHALGLDHSERRDAIMYAVYGYKSNLELSDDDILGVQTVYGDQNGIRPFPRITSTTTTTRRPMTTQSTTPSTTTIQPTTSSITTRPPFQPFPPFPPFQPLQPLQPLTTRSPVTHQTTSRNFLTSIFPQFFTSNFPNFQRTTSPGFIFTQRFTNGPNNRRTTHRPSQQNTRNNRFGQNAPTTGPPRTTRPMSVPFAVVHSKVDKNFVNKVKTPIICSLDFVIDAVFSLEDIMTTYIFQGNVFYKMEKDTPAPGYPRKINQTFPDVGDTVDAAFSTRETSSKGSVETIIYLFKGNRVWKYNTRLDPVWPGDRSRYISEYFQGAPTNIDSAFYYKQYKAIYFFKGTSYYRLSQYLNNADNILEVDQGYPQPIGKWNLPSKVSHVDAVFTWQQNLRTYIFSGTQYYRLDDHESSVDTQTLLPYPRSTRMWWLGCYRAVPLGDATSLVICRPEIDARDMFTIDKTPKGNVILSRQHTECRIIHNQVHSRLPENILPDTSGCSILKTQTLIIVLTIVIHYMPTGSTR